MFPSISIPQNTESEALTESGNQIALFLPDLGPQLDLGYEKHLLLYPSQVTPAPTMASLQPRQNRVRKGEGPESRKRAPDPYDNYPFDTVSFAYARLALHGLHGIRLVSLVKLTNAIEQALIAAGRRLTPRNRKAKRRKSNAFHWLDENWSAIAPIFDLQVRESLT
jgi:hypothetical protein